MNKYIENVLNLKKKLEKGVSYEKTLHILHKLQKIPISIDLLQVTGIGKTVRNLSKKHDNDIGKTAKLLCLTWKAILKEQQEQEEEEQEDNCINNSNETYEESSPVNHNEELDSSDEKVNASFDLTKIKVKNEKNSDYCEENTSDRESKSEYKKPKKRNDDEEDKCYDSGSYRKHSKSSHKKHKSSHKSRESELKNPKTEFEALLGLNDEIIKNNKKISPIKRSEIGSYDTNSETHISINKTNNKLMEKSIKQEKNTAKDESKERNHSSLSFPTALDSKSRLKSLEKMDILSSLPTPNYKPLPNRDLIDERVEANRRKTLKSGEDLSLGIQSKKGRTAVFAGHARSNFYTHVHSLEELCIRVLMDNINKLYCLGDAPYYLIKPVLNKCNAKQLSRIERFNPNLMEETDELWEEFCKKDFRGREPDEDEDESWRELYQRCGKERDDKLKNITKHIVHRQAKALPVRQTVFSENPKTPREVLRRKERTTVNHSIASSSNSYSKAHSSNSSVNHVKIVPDKPKVAPLMKKALKLQKARFRR